MSLGVPIKLLHEAESHVVTVELKSGEVYRGKLVESEDNMNCQLTGVTRTKRDGSTDPLDQAFIRGSHIRFIILPDILKEFPAFRKDLVKAARILGQMEDDGSKSGQRGGRGGKFKSSRGGRGAPSSSSSGQRGR